jgi:hypothetical protein
VHEGSTRVKWSVDAVVLDMMIWLSARLEHTGWDELVPQDELRARLRRVVQGGERLGRLDELKRIAASTLDADMDVWSTTDDGRIVPLTERIASLEAEWKRPAKTA